MQNLCFFLFCFVFSLLQQIILQQNQQIARSVVFFLFRFIFKYEHLYSRAMCICVLFQIEYFCWQVFRFVSFVVCVLLVIIVICRCSLLVAAASC